MLLLKNERKVCVIGERTQLELFEEDENPIGQFISINKMNFTVVGVHKFVQGGGFGDDGDIYIPFATFRKIFNTGDNVGWFMIAADENIDGLKVEKDIKATLKEIHTIHPDDERGIGGFNLGEVFRKTMNFANGLTFSIAIRSNCPPSSTGMGNKFIRPKLMLNIAIIDRKAKSPALAAVPDISAIIIGPPIFSAETDPFIIFMIDTRINLVIL